MADKRMKCLLCTWPHTFRCNAKLRQHVAKHHMGGRYCFCGADVSWSMRGFIKHLSEVGGLYVHMHDYLLGISLAAVDENAPPF